MTETSPTATLAWPPPGLPEDEVWKIRATQGRPLWCGDPHRRRRRATLPNDGVAVGSWRFAVRGSPAPITANTDPRSLNQGGCAPAMSAGSTPGLASRSPTGPRTSSSLAVSGYPRSIWRITSSRIRWFERPRWWGPDERWQERPLAAVVPQPGLRSRRRNYGSSCPTGWFGGGCRSAGLLSMRFRGPVWASMTRRRSGRATPAASTPSSSFDARLTDGYPDEGAVVVEQAGGGSVPDLVDEVVEGPSRFGGGAGAQADEIV